MSTFRNIVHIDLKDGVPSLSGVAPGRGVFVVFWWRDTPLGHRKIEPTELPVSATRFAFIALQSIAPAVNAYFSERGLEMPLRGPERMCASTLDVPALFDKTLTRLDNLACDFPRLREAVNASISVIIPTLNRPARLAACLRSLAALREKPQEIVVVDNAPQHLGTRRVVKNFSHVRYLAEPRTGLSTARNVGVRHISGDIIAFVDDDETVHPEWLTWLRQCFDDPKVMVGTGLVLPAELQSKAQFIFESRFSFIRGYCTRIFDSDFYGCTKSRGVPVWQIGGGGNMAIRRELFELVGSFDESLGAGRAGCSEDTELFYRVLALGWKCRYEPRAVTYHHHRRDMKSLKLQAFSYMRGHVVASLVQYAKHKDRGNLWHLLWTLPSRYARHCLRSLMRDPAYPADVLRAEIAGYLSGAWFYWRNRTSYRTMVRPLPQTTAPRTDAHLSTIES